MTNYLIIDDEQMAHEIIKEYCDLIPDLKLAKHCYDALEALEYLRSNQVDLIFLDLNMPKLKGFDFLRSLSKKPKIIVTTAYKEYALEGYELEISDYLLKPFSFERFLKAVNKALEIDAKHSSRSSTQNKPQKETIFVYADKKHIQITLDEIVYIEAAGNYAKIIFENDQLLVRSKFSYLMEKLPQTDFIRIHKSFIVSKKHIKIIEGNRIKVLENYLPIGNYYKAQVNKLLKE
ncbi:two component transcriptional regulator, LytTR family [Zunongwangia mangrovi]|uniref:Two component transcriptional regulator, LytTR family n=1 Tax=Zunongwangia mangrovi TaxID=1334022 RepID=A0A1I1GAW9_9FLAO|nr:LytTR family DNA-binding domain-containing protein [Zunongwangia mangrovi]SFC08675.1 two component transcriptional regulator, LytTR family [Zunongwangia mangrovi]